MTVCVDASLPLEFLLRDKLWQRCHGIWSRWLVEEEDIVAPPLFFAEVTSVVRERAYRGEFSADEAAGFLSESLAWPISVLDDKTILQPRALDFATRFNRPKAYDAQYLAVADLLACELWTADRRLANMVANDLPWVRFVGEAA